MRNRLTNTHTHIHEFQIYTKAEKKKKKKTVQIAPMNLSSTANTYKTMGNAVSLYMSTHSPPQPYYFEQIDIIFYTLIQKVFSMFPIYMNSFQGKHT